MATQITRLLHPVRVYLSPKPYPFSIIPSSSNRQVFGKFAIFKPGFGGVGLHKQAWEFIPKLRNLGLCTRKFPQLGTTVNIGNISGVSFVFGTVAFWPHFAYAIDSHDALVEAEHIDRHGGLDREDVRSVFLDNLWRLWLPIFFVVTVLGNLYQPCQLMLKILLFLLSTKPSPLSVYLSIERFDSQPSRQFPGLKSPHAKRVEVEDYKILCVARIEMRDQKYTLVGILGGWWLLPFSLHEDNCSIRRWSSKLPKNFTRSRSSASSPSIR